MQEESVESITGSKVEAGNADLRLNGDAMGEMRWGQASEGPVPEYSTCTNDYHYAQLLDQASNDIESIGWCIRRKKPRYRVSSTLRPAKKLHWPFN